MISKGNYVKFVRFTVFFCCCCLPSVKKQNHDFHFFKYAIKQLLDSVFVISRINKVAAGVVKRSP